jgi:transcriptional regulator GlxA family with amidase domain
VHLVAALVLPDVVAFDLAIPSQVFGHRDEQQRYAFTTAALAPGAVPTTSGYAVQACQGLEALADADTFVVPGYAPHEPPAEPVLEALRAAADRGARVVSVCTGRVRASRRRAARRAPRDHALASCR